jgi:hypothetical protein
MEITRIPPVLTLKQIISQGIIATPRQEPKKYPKYLEELKPGQFLENEDICEYTLVWFPRVCNGSGKNRYGEVGLQNGTLIRRYLAPHHKDFIWNVEDESKINKNNFVNKAYRIYRKILYGDK